MCAGPGRRPGHRAPCPRPPRSSILPGAAGAVGRAAPPSLTPPAWSSRNRASQRSAACSGASGLTVRRAAAGRGPCRRPRPGRGARRRPSCGPRSAAPRPSRPGGSGSSPAASRTARSMRVPCAFARAAALPETGLAASSSPSQAARAQPSSPCSARARRSSSAIPSSASISSEQVRACCASERKRRDRPPQRQVLASTQATASKSTSPASTCTGSPGHAGCGSRRRRCPAAALDRCFLFCDHLARPFASAVVFRGGGRIHRAAPGIV